MIFQQDSAYIWQLRTKGENRQKHFYWYSKFKNIKIAEEVNFYVKQSHCSFRILQKLVFVPKYERVRYDSKRLQMKFGINQQSSHHTGENKKAGWIKMKNNQHVPMVRCSAGLGQSRQELYIFHFNGGIKESATTTPRQTKWKSVSSHIPKRN